MTTSIMSTIEIGGHYLQRTNGVRTDGFTGAYVASYGSAVTVRPRATAVRFRDGYEHRTGIGLKRVPSVWNLTFRNESKSIADTLRSFLEDREALESFDSGPSRENSSAENGATNRPVRVTSPSRVRSNRSSRSNGLQDMQRRRHR